MPPCQCKIPMQNANANALGRSVGRETQQTRASTDVRCGAFCDDSEPHSTHAAPTQRPRSTHAAPTQHGRGSPLIVLRAMPCHSLSSVLRPAPHSIVTPTNSFHSNSAVHLSSATRPTQNVEPSAGLTSTAAIVGSRVDILPPFVSTRQRRTICPLSFVLYADPPMASENADEF